MSRRARGRFVTGRPRLVLLAALVFLLLSAVFGADATGRLKTQGYDDPRSESSRAARVAAEHLGASPNLVVVAQARSGSVDGPAARDAGEDLTRRLAAQPHVSAVTSYWTSDAAELRSRDGHAAMLVAHVDGEGEQLGTRVKQLSEELTTPTAATTELTVRVGGAALVDAELQDISESDLKRAEAVVLPGTLILLVLVFGSVVAAALPLLIGVLAVAGTLLVLSVLGAVTDVSVFALNLTTALGLGLGIDYGLLIVSRFREELAKGCRPRNAAIRTVRSAGHTIAFSAATVCAALATLLVFPPYFLRSFAYAGIAVVAIAAVSAVTVLPALLTLLGKRVNAWPVPWRRRARSRLAVAPVGRAGAVRRTPPADRGAARDRPAAGARRALRARRLRHPRRPGAAGERVQPSDRRPAARRVRDEGFQRAHGRHHGYDGVPVGAGGLRPCGCPRSPRSPRSWGPAAASGTERRQCSPAADPWPGPPATGQVPLSVVPLADPARARPSSSCTTSGRLPPRRAPTSSSADRARYWWTPRTRWETGSRWRSP